MNNNHINEQAYSLYNQLANTEVGTKDVELYIKSLKVQVESINYAIRDGLKISTATTSVVGEGLANFVSIEVKNWILNSTNMQQDLHVLKTNPFAGAATIEEFHLYVRTILQHIDEQRRLKEGLITKLKRWFSKESTLLEVYDKRVSRSNTPAPTLVTTTKTA